MSEDDLSDCLEEPNMEIQIKTLMGTIFDMKVSAMDTVADIKKKIYRIEGIPTFQQNLIFQSHNLRDFNRLVDAGITNGSTLTLVISMKGGPISTRRLSVTCEHHMLKELKEIIEDSGEDFTPGSKVSVLVFKEGVVINLLRVIENEDGSYTPYSEKPISPPMKPARRGSRMEIFERFVEDNEMSMKISNLRKRMDEANLRKRGNNSKEAANCTSEPEAGSSCSNKNVLFKFLVSDNIDLKIFEKNSEEDIEEEIALKDKHRSKPHKLPPFKSLYSESKGACSNVKQKYTRINKKTKNSPTSEDSCHVSTSASCHASTSSSCHASTSSSCHASTSSSCHASTSASALATSLVFNKDKYSQSRPIPASNRIHLTRLVLSEGSESPKSSAEGLELEENVQDLWEIHEPVSERLKHSACKVGVLKRRQSMDYTYDSIKNDPKGEIGNYPCDDSDFGVCSSNLYHIPQFVSSSGALQPCHSRNEPSLHDYYFAKADRSPLYSRRDSDSLAAVEAKREGLTQKKFAPADECSGIQRVQNDDTSECDNLFSQAIDDLHGFYNLACSSDLLREKILDLSGKDERKSELPPVIKKKARCNECNRKLNITNIHNCRCGKIFCSQHRYSEVHRCSYDYKLEGRKLLEQQNPRVAAEKINKI